MKGKQKQRPAVQEGPRPRRDVPRVSADPDRGLTMAQIAGKLGLNRSTVCRTLHRARNRLYRSLRYSL